jgi:tripartite-type tricarboxylate transporter receptor subunit TctC
MSRDQFRSFQDAFYEEVRIPMKSILKRVWAIAALAVAFSLPFVWSAQAQEYPNRPIKFIVPVAAGGLTDTMTRLLAQRLSERLGQPVVVENRPGGGGILAMKALAAMPADGYAIILVFPGAAAVTPILYKTPPYETLRDFAPVGRVAMYPMVLIASPSLPGTAKEFVEFARGRPGTLNYGSAGNTTTSHLAMELFKWQVGIDIVHVPFKGEAPALNELMAGRLSVLFQTLTTSLPHIRSGKVRALGVATAQRSKLAPEIPTLAESGVGGLDIPGWYGVLAPAGTPEPIIQRLNREFTAIVSEPQTASRLDGLGVQGWTSTPEELRSWIQVETDRWRKVVTEAGIKAD